MCVILKYSGEVIESSDSSYGGADCYKRDTWTIAMVCALCLCAELPVEVQLHTIR